MSDIWIDLINIKERLSELEKEVNWIKTEYGKLNQKQDKEIAELKELYKNCNELMETNLNLSFRNQEVLRELKRNMVSPILYQLWNLGVFNGEVYGEIYNKGIKIENRLSGGTDEDSGGEKSEFDKDCKRWFKKDSGGEKVEAQSLRANPEIPPPVLGKGDNSKPPEPNEFKCVACGDMFNIWNNGENWINMICAKCYICKPEDRLPGGTGVEPREDDETILIQARRGGKTMLPIIQLIYEEDKRELISEFVRDLKLPYTRDFLIEKWEEKL